MRSFKKDKVPKPKISLEVYPVAPLDLEIGCGVGLHPMTYCQKYPERNLIALDRSRLRMQKLNQSMQGVSLPNLYPVCEDADKFVAHEIKPCTIENIFFLYPNPYPKKAQANKRWHQMPLMALFLEALTPRGNIHLATNEAFYAHEAKTCFVETWYMQISHEAQYKGQLPFAPRTHFEKKYIERGETIFDLVFTKTA